MGVIPNITASEHMHTLRGLNPAPPQIMNQVNTLADVSSEAEAITSSTTLGSIGATFYSGDNFQGFLGELGAGDYNLGDLNRRIKGHDNVASVEVMPGYGIWMYAHANYKGREIYLGASKHKSKDIVKASGEERKHSSIKVVCAPVLDAVSSDEAAKATFIELNNQHLQTLVLWWRKPACRTRLLTLTQ
mmetsp:Transcript_21075/g.31822  ORF Transcript_21075/g.31822 Transcript_21075/m.31822 type:complete len:189 (-) Transcript_21075:1809-2375(-)